jgi:predicted NBD/HSP70 family sugar kinase
MRLNLAFSRCYRVHVPSVPVPRDDDGAKSPINLHRLGRVRILRTLSEHAYLSRADLVTHTGLARASVGSMVVDLIDAGLIEETSDLAGAPGASSAPGVGRPPQLLSLAPTAAHALGADIGHDHVRVILTDLGGTPIWDQGENLDVDHERARALDTVISLIEAAVADTAVPREKVLGLGVGISCPVSADGDLAADGIMPGWDGARPADELASRSGFPARIVNGANAGVLAEQRFGAARDAADVLYLRLSAGIGAGVISGGRVLLGSGGFAGELGHVTVDPNGALCRCGNRGCLETVASPPALAALLARSWGRPVGDDELAGLLRDGDRGTLRAVEDGGEAIGRVLAPAALLLNPSLIVIGGDLADAGEPLFEPIRRALSRGVMGMHTRELRIVPSALGDRAGVLGAAALILDDAPRLLGTESA